MKRKMLAFLISVVLIITSVVPAFVVANAAVWSGSRSVPTITGGVYQIATGENLAWFANAVNTGNATIKAKLTANIMLNSNGSTANSWTPIGTENHPFKGEFDGNGFTISGVYVNSSSVFAGLFGYVSYDEETSAPEDVSPEYIVGTKVYKIKNITVTSSSVSGKQNVGGLVGYASNAGILDCSYSGSVNGTENSIGGIVGWASAGTVVSQCHSSGTINGHQRVGGIAGYINGNAVITKCYANMSITGYWNVGGLIGTSSSASLLGGFFFGSVAADDRAGGIAGYSLFTKMIGAYTISTITNTGSGTEFGGAVGTYYGGTHLNVFYSYEDSGVDGAIGLGRTPTEMKSSEFIKEINHTTPYFCFDYTNVNNGYPVLTWMLMMDVWAGDRTMPQRNSSGTYLISKPSELAWFAALVNGTLSSFERNSSANATVTDNLLFNIDASDESSGRTEWTPIGKSDEPYTGTFNGGGYNIAGIYTSPQSGENGKNVGLFGYIGTGSVTNTVVIDGYISGKENVGGIAGCVSGGSITNSLCNSEVCGDKAVGGIVGNISSSSTISTSAMMGKITGTNFSNEQSFLINIGGVVGYSNRATVTKCFASSDINAPLARYVGGVIGNNASGSVTSCYSTSTIKGFDKIGGIAGKNANGTVTKCYTAGKISGTSQVGMAFGETSGAGVSGCYFDESFKSLSNTEIGATGASSSRMTGSSSVSSLGLGGDFKATADDTYFFYYPQISSFTYSSLNVLKSASVKSVKRVQSKYVARVEIDGRTDTYYETLESAFAYASSTASTVLPTVFLVRDFVLQNTINVAHTVGFFGENGAILTRSGSLTGAMINVTGDLTIGSVLYGDDDELSFFIDGNNVSATASAITVASDATLRIVEGVCVRNCRTASTSVRGAAVNNVGGTVIMSGGVLDSNISKTVAGAIYNENGTVNVSGGKITGCEATQGAAVYNNNGNASISGGLFTGNIASQFGGAVAGNGLYSETTISDKAELTENQATYGGALAVRGNGTLNISGGIITANRAYSQGGAFYIEAASESTISGGTISTNIAQNPADSSAPAYGGAIYNNGDLSLKGKAQIDSDNDIFLPSGKYVTVSDRLSCEGHAAKITPATYAENVKILDGANVGSNYTKFGLSNTGWHILANGKITGKTSSTVAILSKNNNYSVEYISLVDAFSAVNEGETAIVTVVADNIITDTIPVRGDITLTCDENTFVSTRNGSFHGVLFDVYPNAVLRFGDSEVNASQQAQADYTAGTQTAGQMVIDGGYRNTGITGAAAVNVQSGGEFYMYDDAIIRNCRNTTTGTVTVSGKMHMYGGLITDNISNYGGAIYLNRSTAELNTYGGVIANNTSENGGSAVYSLGKVTRNIHSYNFYYINSITDEDGNVILEEPEYKMTAKTDILIADGDDVFLNTNLIYTGETESVIYIRSLNFLPEDKPFVLNNITFSLKTYTVGNVVIMGENVVDCFHTFISYIDGYYIQSNGKLAVNKLVLKQNSTYRVNRTKNIVSGVVIGSNTVSKVVSQFVNNTSFVRVVSASGTTLRNLATVTTGCKVRLVDSSNAVVDELTIVIYGDLNGDQKTDAQDAVLVRAVAAGMLHLGNATSAVIEAADINGDGAVTSIDADSVEECGISFGTIEQTR